MVSNVLESWLILEMWWHHLRFLRMMRRRRSHIVVIVITVISRPVEVRWSFVLICSSILSKKSA